MKLKSISLENYGVYASRRFEFDSAPFVLVYGANESGKTTALNGIRQSLFGFPVRTPYRLSGQMQSSVAAELEDGRQLEFVRRKGRSNQVQCTIDSIEVEEADLSATFGNLSLEHYQAIFGISLKELQQGEDALKSTPLFSALTGSGTTGISLLQELKQKALDSASDLFRSRGSNYPINKLLDHISEQRDRANQAAVAPTAINNLRVEIAETQRLSKQLRERYESSFHRRARLQAQLRVLPKLRALREATERLKHTDVPDGVDRTAVANWQEYSKRRKSLAERKEELSKKLIYTQKLLNQLPRTTGTSSQAPAIERLGHQAADIEFKRKQLVESSDGASKSRTVLAGLAVELELPLDSLLATPDILPQVSQRQRSHWKDASAEVQELRRDAQALRDQIRSADQSLSELQRAFIEQLQASNTSNSGLTVDIDQVASEHLDDDFVAELAPEQTELAHLSRLVQDCVAAEQEVKQCEADLRGRGSDPGFVELQEKASSLLRPGEILLASFSTPDLKWFDQTLSTEAELLKEREAAKKQSAALSQEIDSLRGREQSADDLTGTKLLERIDELRSRRDKLLQNWNDDLSQPLIAQTLDAEEQTQRLGELQSLFLAIDDAYSELTLSAKTLAKIQHEQTVLADKEQQLGECAEAMSHIEAQLAALRAEVEEHTKALPLRSATLRELAAWSEHYSRWCAAQLRIDEAARKLLQSQSVLRSRRDAIIDHWPEVLRDEFDIEDCVASLNDWQRIRESYQQLTRRSAKFLESQNRNNARSVELERAVVQIEDKFSRWLMEHTIGGSWDIADFDALTETLDRAAHELNTHIRTLRQATELNEQITAFENSIKDVSSTLSEDAASAVDSKIPPEDLAKQWLSAIQKDRSNSQERLRLSTELEHCEATIKELDESLTLLDEKLAEIATAVGSVGSVDKVMQSIIHAEEFRATIAQCRSAIESSGVSVEDMESLDESAATLEVEDLNRVLADLDVQRQESDRKSGQLAEQLKQMSNSDASAEHLQSIQNARSELAELAQQWLVQRTAVFVAERALALHAKENEPRLLQLSKHYLSQLTRGKYVGVEHQPQGKSAKSQQVSVRRADGATKWPSELSTGTREQLYLALRMAFVQQYAETHEPLPVLMDDCLVNFDDDRMESAIESFGNWDSRVQTILFSCHSRSLDVVRRSLPNARIIELDKLGEPVAVT